MQGIKLGDIFNKDVQVKNTTSYDTLIRVKLTSTITDASNNGFGLDEGSKLALVLKTAVENNAVDATQIVGSSQVNP